MFEPDRRRSLACVRPSRTCRPVRSDANEAAAPPRNKEQQNFHDLKIKPMAILDRATTERILKDNLFRREHLSLKVSDTEKISMLSFRHLCTDTSKPNAESSFARYDFFKDGPTPASFSFIFAFSFRNLVVSRIRTRIIRVEGKNADH